MKWKKWRKKIRGKTFKVQFWFMQTIDFLRNIFSIIAFPFEQFLELLLTGSCGKLWEKIFQTNFGFMAKSRDDDVLSNRSNLAGYSIYGKMSCQTQVALSFPSGISMRRIFFFIFFHFSIAECRRSWLTSNNTRCFRLIYAHWCSVVFAEREFPEAENVSRSLIQPASVQSPSKVVRTMQTTAAPSFSHFEI